MQRRHQKRLDYAIFHKTGDKIYKNRDIVAMSVTVELELKVVCKINRFLDENESLEFSDVDEVNECLDKMRELQQEYEDVHVELRRELGDDEYEKTYTEFKNSRDLMMSWLKNAKTKRAKFKKQSSEKSLESLRAEERCVHRDILRELDNINNEKPVLIEDYERQIAVAEKSISSYSHVFRKIEEQGPDFSDEFGKKFEELCNSLNHIVITRRDTIRNIKVSAQNREEQRLKEEASVKTQEEEDKNVLFCETIHTNICDRFSSLEAKIKVQMSDLTDAQVLEKRGEIKHFEKEFNEILDKILKLSQLNPSRYEETKDLLMGVNRRKHNLKSALESLQDRVNREILDRDISEEKIKNSATLGIKLPKFEGYNSPLDFFTFKSKFNTLVAPRIKSCLLPDHLKCNYLAGQALQLVKEMDNVDEIWGRLEECFGDVATLLNMKLEKVSSCTPLIRVKGEQKINESLITITNLMKELSTLAQEHGIEQSLYHSSNLSKIFGLLGKKRQVDIMKSLLDFDTGEKETWEHILTTLNKEIRVNEKLLLLVPASPSNSPSDSGKDKPGYHNVSLGENLTCHICGKNDHIPTITRLGHKVINYHSCEKFVKMNPKERFEELLKKKLCAQCLTPGRKFGHKGRCFDKYICPDPTHRSFPTGIHILVCDTHKHKTENSQLLEMYRIKCIENFNQAEFSKSIRIAFHIDTTLMFKVGTDLDDDCNKDVSVYMLQTIVICGFKFNIFYDNGCTDLVVTKAAADILHSIGKARNVSRKKMSLTGISDLQTVCHHGKYEIILPLHNGKEIKLTGSCLDKITSCFPTFPLDKVGEELAEVSAANGVDPETLPKLPPSVGGDTDIMIGIQYYKYWPDQVSKLPNGLRLYESQFDSYDGTQGVVGGPHMSFNDVHDAASHHVYFSDEVRLFVQGHLQGLDTGIRDVTSKQVEFSGAMSEEYSIAAPGEEVCAYPMRKMPKQFKTFENIENAGTEISYRCIECRGCTNCKKSSEIECISIEKEVQQGMIDKSVIVNPVECYSEAYLPFLCDPTKKLVDNYGIAEKFYHTQVKKLNAKPQDKMDVINSMKKLETLGYVSKLSDLSDEQQALIESSPVKYYIPWFAVWNSNSISTPCRAVFNASSQTASGYSLNDLLPTGRNNLNKLIQIFILWLTFFCAFCTDIQKMYNSIRLVERHWCYQLFLWNEELKPDVKPDINVIKSLIYGVRTSGNQAERALRETTKLFSEEYPRQNEIIQNQTYVDDCASGETVFENGQLDKGLSYDKAREVTDDLQALLSKGNFNLKGVTYSGHDPPEHLRNTDNSVTVFGYKWFPKLDELNLNIGEPSPPKKRSKHPGKTDAKKLTRTACASRVGQIFDINGRFAPLVSEMKLDLNVLCKRKLDWVDDIPDDLISTWLKNFDTVSQIREIRFRRCVVPGDALNLDVETIEISDASPQMACSAIYVRFKRKNGLYSCQLIFARTKIVPDDMTLPRAELFAASLNATTGHIVKLSLQDLVKSRVSLVDSQISLFWIVSTHTQLKQWVRSRVIEINRLTTKTDWFYVDSKSNMADIATRRGAKLSDVAENSPWISGYEWAQQSREKFPIKSAEEIKLSSDEQSDFRKEFLSNDVTDPEWVQKQLSENYYCGLPEGTLEKVGKMYKFSGYIIDPNKFHFKKVVRILSLVLLFIRNIKHHIAQKKGVQIPNPQVCNKLPSLFSICDDKILVTEGNDPLLKCPKGLIVKISEQCLRDSLNYFFRKATRELKHFNRKASYEKISTEKEGLLFYTGRILPSQRFDNKSELHLSDACIDLSESTFCVPMVDKRSPLAYALINLVHWHDPDAQHSGNETVMRHLMKICFVIEGSLLVQLFRKNCPRCRYLHKKKIEVVMGPKSNVNLAIAPAFFYTQVDLIGPFDSYNNSNKRATVKIWFAIFCCSVTGATDLKVVEDYSTSSFVLAFIRFACTFGYPKKLLPDAGSQLLKACTSMTLTFLDIKHQLSEHGVEFEPCPVNAHYMHGKVERKIRHVRETFSKHLQNQRLSLIQWETLGYQVANTINNLPIASGKATLGIEHLDLITPNRLLLGRNNTRSPVGTVTVTEDVGKIISQNNKIFQVWFKAWLTSCVPSLMQHPKWFRSDIDPKIGDVILFLKSEKEFESIYHYGLITDLKVSRDGKIRQVEIEYQNHNENVKRKTNRGTREISVIHPFEELGLIRELNILATSLE